jgi:hypothetical protein
MANGIVLIAMIAATKGSFVSDAFGFSTFCVEPAIKLTLFTAYRFVNGRLDGALPYAFKEVMRRRRTTSDENALCFSVERAQRKVG